MAKKLLVAAGVVAVVVLSNAGLTLADGVSERALGDRPDDVSGLQQVHLLYVLASDGEDRALDTDGTLVASAASAQAWLSAQTGGRTFRVDRFAGAPDITFVRLSQSEADLSANGLFIRDELERRLVARGFTDPLKIYAAYYDGAANGACGGAFYPPSLPGSLVALYLRGLPGPGFLPCADNSFAGASESSGLLGVWATPRDRARARTRPGLCSALSSCGPHIGQPDRPHVRRARAVDPVRARRRERRLFRPWAPWLPRSRCQRAPRVPLTAADG